MIPISMISPGALRLPDAQQNISCSWWVLQGWTVKSSTAVFHGMFGLEMPRRLSFKAVNQTANGSCHCSCQHLGIHWLTGHHFGKMLFTGWLAIYMVCQMHRTFGRKKSLVDSPVWDMWGTISIRCCSWNLTTPTKSCLSSSATWTISMASTGRTMTLVKSIGNSSGASCSFSRLTSLRLSNGKELCYKLNKENRVVLHITMKKFLETVEPYELPRGRMKQPEVLTSDEQKEFRSIAGCLQWLGSQTRPDVSPAISLCNHGQQTTIHDLKTLAETLQHAKNTQELGLVIQDVPVNKESVLMTYTDASWANAAHTLHLRWGSWWHWQHQMWPARWQKEHFWIGVQLAVREFAEAPWLQKLQQPTRGQTDRHIWTWCYLRNLVLWTGSSCRMPIG